MTSRHLSKYTIEYNLRINRQSYKVPVYQQKPTNDIEESNYQYMAACDRVIAWF